MENTERIIAITVAAVLLLTTLFAILIAFLNSRSVKPLTEIVKARNEDTAWQDRTEAGLKELGLASARAAEGWRQAVGMLVSAALLVNKEDAADFFKNLEALGIKVLDGLPNVAPVAKAKSVDIDHPLADG